MGRRMKSMVKDPSECEKLVWGRWKNFGATVSSEFYQPCPFFFTREKWPVQMVGHYRGTSAFLICSGPSFAKMDKTPLSKPGVWTMTTNNAVASWRGNASIIVDAPTRFVMSMWMDPTIMKFVPADQFEKHLWDNRTIMLQNGKVEDRWEPCDIRVGDCPNVIGYHRNQKFAPWRWLYEDTINWGNDAKYGGSKSVMLAAIRVLWLLGFRNVYLLGVDFEMSRKKKYSFDEERHKGAIKCNTNTYSRMQEWFAQLQPHFLAENFIIKNCSPDSKLEAFPKCSLEEAVEEATREVGDVSKERTRGMYTDYEDKLKAYRESVLMQGGSPKELPPNQATYFLSDEKQPKKVAKTVKPAKELVIAKDVPPPKEVSVEKTREPEVTVHGRQPPPELIKRLEDMRRQEEKKLKRHKTKIADSKK